MKNKLDIITCPCCGREYLPSEIYLPDDFLGKPTSIYRDSNERVEGIVGKSMNLRENYICDSCNTPFSIYAKVQFFTEEIKDENFNKTYVSKLHKESLFLSEE